LKKPGVLVYGIVSHVVVLACFLWFALWIARIGIPDTIDSGTPGNPVASFVINMLLLTVFCGAHSVFARSSVKARMRRVFPQPLERATYCLIFSLGLVGLCFAYRPMPGVVWRITSPAGVAAIWALFILSWAAHFASLFWMGYAEFFGLRQTWFAARGEEYRPPPPQTKRDFALSHILLIVSLSIISWWTPVMSVGQLWFCIFVVVYDIVGAWLSSRDLSDVPAPVAGAVPRDRVIA